MSSLSSLSSEPPRIPSASPSLPPPSPTPLGHLQFEGVGSSIQNTQSTLSSSSASSSSTSSSSQQFPQSSSSASSSSSSSSSQSSQMPPFQPVLTPLQTRRLPHSLTFDELDILRLFDADYKLQKKKLLRALIKQNTIPPQLRPLPQTQEKNKLKKGGLKQLRVFRNGWGNVGEDEMIEKKQAMKRGMRKKLQRLEAKKKKEIDREVRRRRRRLKNMGTGVGMGMSVNQKGESKRVEVVGFEGDSSSDLSSSSDSDDADEDFGFAMVDEGDEYANDEEEEYYSSLSDRSLDNEYQDTELSSDGESEKEMDASLDTINDDDEEEDSDSFSCSSLEEELDREFFGSQHSSADEDCDVGRDDKETEQEKKESEAKRKEKKIPSSSSDFKPSQPTSVLSDLTVLQRLIRFRAICQSHYPNCHHLIGLPEASARAKNGLPLRHLMHNPLDIPHSSLSSPFTRWRSMFAAADISGVVSVIRLDLLQTLFVVPPPSSSPLNIVRSVNWSAHLNSLCIVTERTKTAEEYESDMRRRRRSKMSDVERLKRRKEREFEEREREEEEERQRRIREEKESNGSSSNKAHEAAAPPFSSPFDSPFSPVSPRPSLSSTRILSVAEADQERAIQRWQHEKPIVMDLSDADQELSVATTPALFQYKMSPSQSQSQQPQPTVLTPSFFTPPSNVMAQTLSPASSSSSSPQQLHSPSNSTAGLETQKYYNSNRNSRAMERKNIHKASLSNASLPSFTFGSSLSSPSDVDGNSAYPFSFAKLSPSKPVSSASSSAAYTLPSLTSTAARHTAAPVLPFLPAAPLFFSSPLSFIVSNPTLSRKSKCNCPSCSASPASLSLPSSEKYTFPFSSTATLSHLLPMLPPSLFFQSSASLGFVSAHGYFDDGLLFFTKHTGTAVVTKQTPSSSPQTPPTVTTTTTNFPFFLSHPSPFPGWAGNKTSNIERAYQFQRSLCDIFENLEGEQDRQRERREEEERRSWVRWEEMVLRGIETITKREADEHKNEKAEGFAGLVENSSSKVQVILESEEVSEDSGGEESKEEAIDDIQQILDNLPLPPSLIDTKASVPASQSQPKKEFSQSLNRLQPQVISSAQSHAISPPSLLQPSPFSALSSSSSSTPSSSHFPSPLETVSSAKAVEEPPEKMIVHRPVVSNRLDPPPTTLPSMSVSLKLHSQSSFDLLLSKEEISSNSSVSASSFEKSSNGALINKQHARSYTLIPATSPPLARFSHRAQHSHIPSTSFSKLRTSSKYEAIPSHLLSSPLLTHSASVVVPFTPKSSSLHSSYSASYLTSKQSNFSASSRSSVRHRSTLSITSTPSLLKSTFSSLLSKQETSSSFASLLHSQSQQLSFDPLQHNLRSLHRYAGSIDSPVLSFMVSSASSPQIYQSSKPKSSVNVNMSSSSSSSYHPRPVSAVHQPLMLQSDFFRRVDAPPRARLSANDSPFSQTASPPPLLHASPSLSPQDPTSPVPHSLTPSLFIPPSVTPPSSLHEGLLSPPPVHQPSLTRTPSPSFALRPPSLQNIASLSPAGSYMRKSPVPFRRNESFLTENANPTAPLIIPHLAPSDLLSVIPPSIPQSLSLHNELARGSSVNDFSDDSSSLSSHPVHLTVLSAVLVSLDTGTEIKRGDADDILSLICAEEESEKRKNEKDKELEKAKEKEKLSQKTSDKQREGGGWAGDEPSGVFESVFWREKLRMRQIFASLPHQLFTLKRTQHWVPDLTHSSLPPPAPSFSSNSSLNSSFAQSASRSALTHYLPSLPSSLRTTPSFLLFLLTRGHELALPNYTPFYPRSFDFLTQLTDHSSGINMEKWEEVEKADADEEEEERLMLECFGMARHDSDVEELTERKKGRHDKLQHSSKSGTFSRFDPLAIDGWKQVLRNSQTYNDDVLLLKVMRKLEKVRRECLRNKMFRKREKALKRKEKMRQKEMMEMNMPSQMYPSTNSFSSLSPYTSSPASTVISPLPAPNTMPAHPSASSLPVKKSQQYHPTPLKDLRTIKWIKQFFTDETLPLTGISSSSVTSSSSANRFLRRLFGSQSEWLSLTRRSSAQTRHQISASGGSLLQNSFDHFGLEFPLEELGEKMKAMRKCVKQTLKNGKIAEMRREMESVADPIIVQTTPPLPSNEQSKTDADGKTLTTSSNPEKAEVELFIPPALPRKRTEQFSLPPSLHSNIPQTIKQKNVSKEKKHLSYKSSSLLLKSRYFNHSSFASLLPVSSLVVSLLHPSNNMHFASGVSRVPSWRQQNSSILSSLTSVFSSSTQSTSAADTIDLLTPQFNRRPSFFGRSSFGQQISSSLLSTLNEAASSSLPPQSLVAANASFSSDPLIPQEILNSASSSTTNSSNSSSLSALPSNSSIHSSSHPSQTLTSEQYSLFVVPPSPPPRPTAPSVAAANTPCPPSSLSPLTIAHVALPAHSAYSRVTIPLCSLDVNAATEILSSFMSTLKLDDNLCGTESDANGGIAPEQRRMQRLINIRDHLAKQVKKLIKEIEKKTATEKCSGKKKQGTQNADKKEREEKNCSKDGMNQTTSHSNDTSSSSSEEESTEGSSPQSEQTDIDDLDLDAVLLSTDGEEDASNMYQLSGKSNKLFTDREYMGLLLSGQKASLKKRQKDKVIERNISCWAKKKITERVNILSSAQANSASYSSLSAASLPAHSNQQAQNMVKHDGSFSKASTTFHYSPTTPHSKSASSSLSHKGKRKMNAKKDMFPGMHSIPLPFADLQQMMGALESPTPLLDYPSSLSSSFSWSSFNISPLIAEGAFDKLFIDNSDKFGLRKKQNSEKEKQMNKMNSINKRKSRRSRQKSSLVSILSSCSSASASAVANVARVLLSLLYSLLPWGLSNIHDQDVMNAVSGQANDSSLSNDTNEYSIESSGKSKRSSKTSKKLYKQDRKDEKSLSDVCGMPALGLSLVMGNMTPQSITLALPASSYGVSAFCLSPEATTSTSLTVISLLNALFIHPNPNEWRSGGKEVEVEPDVLPDSAAGLTNNIAGTEQLKEAVTASSSGAKKTKTAINEWNEFVMREISIVASLANGTFSRLLSNQPRNADALPSAMASTSPQSSGLSSSHESTFSHYSLKRCSLGVPISLSWSGSLCVSEAARGLTYSLIRRIPKKDLHRLINVCLSAAELSVFDYESPAANANSSSSTAITLPDSSWTGGIKDAICHPQDLKSKFTVGMKSVLRQQLQTASAKKGAVTEDTKNSDGEIIIQSLQPSSLLPLSSCSSLSSSSNAITASSLFSVISVATMLAGDIGISRGGSRSMQVGVEGVIGSVLDVLSSGGVESMTGGIWLLCWLILIYRPYLSAGEVQMLLRVLFLDSIERNESGADVEDDGAGESGEEHRVNGTMLDVSSLEKDKEIVRACLDWSDSYLKNTPIISDSDEKEELHLLDDLCSDQIEWKKRKLSVLTLRIVTHSLKKRRKMNEVIAPDKDVPASVLSTQRDSAYHSSLQNSNKQSRSINRIVGVSHSPLNDTALKALFTFGKEESEQMMELLNKVMEKMNESSAPSSSSTSSSSVSQLYLSSQMALTPTTLAAHVLRIFTTQSGLSMFSRLSVDERRVAVGMAIVSEWVLGGHTSVAMSCRLNLIVEFVMRVGDCVAAEIGYGKKSGSSKAKAKIAKQQQFTPGFCVFVQKWVYSFVRCLCWLYPMATFYIQPFSNVGQGCSGSLFLAYATPSSSNTSSSMSSSSSSSTLMAKHSLNVVDVFGGSRVCSVDGVSSSAISAIRFDNKGRTVAVFGEGEGELSVWRVNLGIDPPSISRGVLFQGTHKRIVSIRLVRKADKDKDKNAAAAASIVPVQPANAPTSRFNFSLFSRKKDKDKEKTRAIIPSAVTVRSAVPVSDVTLIWKGDTVSVFRWCSPFGEMEKMNLFERNELDNVCHELEEIEEYAEIKVN